MTHSAENRRVSTRPLLKKLLCFLISLVLTGLIFTYETRQAENQRIESLLRWSHQISQQAEALRLFAKEKNEPDPISWAVKYLMVGDDTRPLTIKPYYENEGTSHLENFSFNSKFGDFYYFKILNAENNQGIQLKIHSDPILFVGAKTIWMNDALLLATFLVIYLSLLTLFPWSDLPSLESESKGSSEVSVTEVSVISPTPPLSIEAPSENTAPPQNEFKITLQNWMQDAKKVLLTLGKAVRGVTQEAKNLLELAVKSKRNLELGLEAAEAIKKTVEDLDLIALQPSDNIEQLREAIEILKALGDTTSNQINAVLTEYQSTVTVTAKLSESITQANESILDEAKQFHALKAEIQSKEIA